MTLPIVTVVRTDETRSVMSRDVTVAYFLPTELQAQPPRPSDSEILIEIWPATTVYTRSAIKHIHTVLLSISNNAHTNAPLFALLQGLYRCHQ